MKTPICLGVLLAIMVVPVMADDWPQWMGPHRDSVWSEKGVAKNFPPGGPKVLWRKPVGVGYGGPAVADGKVYVMDYLIEEGKIVNNPGKAIPLKGKERILCFDAKSGKTIWEDVSDIAYELSYPSGPRATPTVSDGKVYALGAMGNLTCLDAKSGKRIWAHDLPKKYGVQVPIWGHSAHPLVFKNKVFCMVGGQGSATVAFDATTGKELWKAIDSEKTSYAPPSLINLGWTEQLLIFTPKNLHSLDPFNGNEYWQLSIRPDYDMAIMAPLESEGRVFVSGIGRKGLLAKITDGPDGASPKAEVMWRPGPKEGVYCANGPPVIVGDVIYGNDIRTSSVIAVDMADGKRLWTSRKPTVGEGDDEGGRVNHGTVYLVYHEGNKLFYLFNERGDLIIADLSPKGYKEISRAHILEPTNEAFGRKVVWSMPAFALRSAFMRNDKELVRVDLSE